MGGTTPSTCEQPATGPSQCVSPAGHKPAQLALLRRNVKRFRGGLVFKAHRLCVSLNSRLKSNKDEEEEAVGIREVGPGRFLKPALVFKADRPLYHSTLGLRVIEKKRSRARTFVFLG